MNRYIVDGVEVTAKTDYEAAKAVYGLANKWTIMSYVYGGKMLGNIWLYKATFGNGEAVFIVRQIR